MPAAHWSARYVGRPYVPGAFDCADLVVLVAREVFGREVSIPADRAPGALGRVRQIGAGIDELVERVETPREGDVVLLVTRGRAQHLGVLCEIAGERWVLHNMRTKPPFANGFDGGVVLHRVRDLEGRSGYFTEGYYRWR